jgi:hypothetical protein
MLGFHYRFSTRVGTEMGLQIGEYVVNNVMQPVMTAAPQQLPPKGLVSLALPGSYTVQARRTLVVPRLSQCFAPGGALGNGLLRRV